MKRLSIEEIVTKREEYYDDALYVTLSDAIDEVETRAGGLTPEEVWTEVIQIKDILLATKRPDKTIQAIRTQLERKYSTFEASDSDHRVERDEIPAGWTCTVVLTCFMLYICTASPVPEENMKIAVKIRILVADHPAYIIIRRLQRPAEQEEEGNGNPIPNENRLHPAAISYERPELVQMRARFAPVCTFYMNTLIARHAVSADYLVKVADTSRFCQIWNSLLRNEGILRTLALRTLDIDGFIASRIINFEEARTTNYNLKLILNIIGIMKSEGVVTLSNEELSNLFFTKMRASYFSRDQLLQFGRKASSLTPEIYDDIVAIIRNI